MFPTYSLADRALNQNEEHLLELRECDVLNAAVWNGRNCEGLTFCVLLSPLVYDGSDHFPFRHLAWRSWGALCDSEFSHGHGLGITQNPKTNCCMLMLMIPPPLPTFQH